MLHARADAIGQTLDRLRLVAARFEVRDDLERSPLRGGMKSRHTCSLRWTVALLLPSALIASLRVVPRVEVTQRSLQFAIGKSVP